MEDSEIGFMKLLTWWAYLLGKIDMGWEQHHQLAPLVGAAEYVVFRTFPLAVNPTTNIKDEGLWNLSLPNIILLYLSLQ